MKFLLFVRQVQTWMDRYGTNRRLTREDRRWIYISWCEWGDPCPEAIAAQVMQVFPQTLADLKWPPPNP